MGLFTEIKLIAFDLDGTLVDSAEGLAQAVDLAVKEMGLPAAGVARVSNWIGNGADIMMQRALTWALADTPTCQQMTQARQLFDKFYQTTAATGSQLYPGVKSTLEQLRSAGFTMALVTNKPSAFVPGLLASLGIAEYFSLVLGGDDVAKKKPHPAALFQVLGHFGLLQQELLFVGDSHNDIQAATAAGVASVGVSYGYNHGQPIAESHPTAILDHFEQLLPALGR